MPTKRPQLANGEIYHIILRGVERIDIFKNDSDYFRCIYNLFEFNDIKRSGWEYRRCMPKLRHKSSSQADFLFQRPRDLLVSIMAYCLMPNHIHLLLRQEKDKGITDFMRKFGTGYAGYFNKKYERQGHLFQGRFKAVHIRTNNQLKSVFVYIHTNPAVLIDSNWKEGGIKNTIEIIKFIENYRWSSYSDYLNKIFFPLVTQRNLFNQIMAACDWRRFVNEWVEYKSLKCWDKSVELE
jgi:putative transposase